MQSTFSAARVAIIAAVFLGLFASRALAIGDPIPGIDIVVKKNPGGQKHPISVSTNKDGTYEFKGLTPGNYDLLIDGHRVQTISVGADRSIGGVLNRTADGMASITFNGQAAALGPAAAIVATRDKPYGKANIGGVDDKLPDGPQPQRVATEDTMGALAGVSTTRGRVGKPDAPDGPPSAPVVTSRSNKRAASGLAGVVDPATGGNQRAATEDTTGALSAVSTTRGRVGKPGTPDGDGTSLPGKAGDPISDTPIGLEGDPEGARVGTTTTDKSGAFNFGKVPAGKYKLVIAGQPDRWLSVGADGIASGKVLLGKDGSLSIFDRWGKVVTASKAENKASATGAENDAVLPSAPVSTSRSNKKR